MGVRKRAVLLVGRLIGNNLLVARLPQATGKNIEAFTAIEDTISRWLEGTRNPVEDTVGGSFNIFGLPASGEVVVPVRRGGLIYV